MRKRSLTEWTLLGSLYGNGVQREPGVIRAADYVHPIHSLEVMSKPVLLHISADTLIMRTEIEANRL